MNRTQTIDTFLGQLPKYTKNKSSMNEEDLKNKKETHPLRRIFNHFFSW